MIVYRNAILGWDAINLTMKEMATKQELQTYEAMQAELDRIQAILKNRPHVYKN